MASNKKYAYYLRGNKLAIIESGLGTGVCSLTDYKDKSACETAGGTWTSNASGIDDGIYRSPRATIADGLEIEYAYSPTYWINNELGNHVNQFYINGWTAVDGYLVFIRSHLGGTGPNWGGSPYSNAGVDEYIMVKGSNRWNGLHKVKSQGSTGELHTYTKVHETVPGFTGSSNVDIAGESSSKSKVNVNNGSNIYLGSIFSEGDYIAIDNSTGAGNNGLWKISEMVTDDTGTAEEDQYFYIKNKYHVLEDIVEEDGLTDLTKEYEDTTPNTTTQNNGSIRITKAYRDHCYIVTDVNVMEDESFDLDIDPYLAKAVVSYLKARLGEDAMNIEIKEYYMKEFYRMLDKHGSSKIKGMHFIQSPSIGIR